MKTYVARQEEQSRRMYVDPALIAGGYALLGEKDKAFTWLEKAYAEKSHWLTYHLDDPTFDSLRSDPRYADLRSRMNLPL